MEILGVLSLPAWLIWLIFLATSFYLYHTWNFRYFKSRGIPGPEPKFIWGSLGDLIEKGFHGELLNLVNKYGKIIGILEGRLPALVVSDVNIIKQIMVKDFGNFVNRRPLFLRGPVKKFLFDTRGHDWKRIRNLMTPTFTSGKMRQMNDAINSAADELMENMQDAAEKNTVIEARSTSGCYVMDVIAAVAFGIKTNSQKDKHDPFVREARTAFDDILTSPLVAFVMILPHLFVPIFETLGFSTFKSSSLKFFRKVVEAALDLRKKDKTNTKVDFLKLMMDANVEDLDQGAKAELTENGIDSKTPVKGLTNDEIFGQSIGFFLAGYETTATTMGYLIYNLATTPEAQEKARAEVDEIMGTNPIPTYDSVLKMPYLEMCISETLRMFPPIPMIDRQAGKDLTIDGLNIPKDMVVNIPIYALHHNPEVWPEPSKFKPERFTPEAKESRDPYNYIPFGYGPRLCIGMRLAQMELKIGVARLLQKFRFVSCKETQIPVKLKPGFFAVPEKGLMVKIEKR